MRAAVGRRNSVTIPAIGTVGIERPRNGPFNTALRIWKILRPSEEFGGGAVAGAKLFAQMVGQATGELEHCLGGHIFAGQFRIAAPADFDASKQISL